MVLDALHVERTLYGGWAWNLPHQLYQPKGGTTVANNDIVVAWLNDAHAMEKALTQILEHQVKDAERFPEIQAKLQQHLQQTEQHAQMVESCVQRLGGSTSSVKGGMASLFGQVQALSTGAAQDEMVKNALADYAAENFEIASYQALIAAAQAIGDTETVTVCQQILADEQAMARWLETNLPALVQGTLSALQTA